MVRSDSAKAIDATVRRLARQPTLVSFTRRGRWLIRSVADVYQCLYIQASMWNDPAEAQFAVNMYVIWPRWDELWTGRPFTGAQGAAPIVDVRLGVLAFGRDHWWSVQRIADADDVAAEIRTAWDEHGCAVFSKFSSSVAALAALDAEEALPVPFHRELIHAALLVDAGRRAEASTVVAHALAENPNWEAGRTVAARLGFDAA